VLGYVSALGYSLFGKEKVLTKNEERITNDLHLPATLLHKRAPERCSA
jgi:hypothetical protein